LTDSLEPASDGRPQLKNLVAVPTYRNHPATRAHDIEGTAVDGEPVRHALLGTGRFSLLLFLSSSCHGCVPMWEASATPRRFGLTDDEVLIVVTRGPTSEPADAIRSLSPPNALTVMSDSAYRDYRVHGAPFFVLVDGTADWVPTEGVAWGTEHVAEHVIRARRGEGRPDVPRLGLDAEETQAPEGELRRG
jgi:hypothetical protein